MDSSSVRMRLSIVHARRTSRILKANAIQFSPCIGLLGTSTPNLIANLRALQLEVPACELARELFHQRTSSYDDRGVALNRRYGPVAITKSRSRASYWLSPQIMGTMIGLAHSTHLDPHSLADHKIDDALRAVGIETNYVNREWTGVSMVRYRKIVRLLATDRELDKSINKSNPYFSALPVALSFVWEKAKTKKCLLDFLLAIEAASGDRLLRPEFDDLRVKDSSMQKEWISSQFPHDFVTAERVRAAGPVLLHPSHPSSPLPSTACTASTAPKASSTRAHDVGEALEILSASLAMERSFKSPIKLGRYAYGDGKARPDCVEVVVREILDSLIYDASSGRLCPELLPATALPAVVAFYTAMEAGEISDVSTMPSNASTGSKKSDKQNKAGVGSKAVEVDARATSEESIAAESAGAVKQYWETTTAGRVWFDLCSELPGAGYLSSTSEGRQYELKPTMLNVCAAVRILLGVDATLPHTTASASSSDHQREYISSGGIWKLKDLEIFWNKHASDLLSRDKNSPVRPIRTSESTLRFRAPFSDTETINRELGSIHFVGGRNAIDIELESAHQLATVKHRLCVNPEERMWSAESRKVFAAHAADPRVMTDTHDVPRENVRSIVCSAVLGDALLTALLESLRYTDNNTVRDWDPQILEGRVLQALLAARWGEERRQGSDSADAEGDGATLSVTDASLTTADAKRQVDSSVLMSSQALELIGYCHNPVLAAQLVKWMLQEAPPQLTFDVIAAILQRYPPSIRSAQPFHAMIDAVFGATQEHSVMLRRIVQIGTEDCSSKNKFALFDGGDALNLLNKLKVVAFYAKYRIKV